MSTPRRSGIHFLATLTVAVLAGCAHPSRIDPARTGAFFTPPNHSGDASLGGIRRVVVLPIWAGEGTPPESAAALDPIFLTALQQEKRFEVVTLSREDCRRRFRSESLCSAAALPADLFPILQREFAAEAVLFVDITSYSAYRPLALGLRSKLALIDGSRLIWTFDNIFSPEAPMAANSTWRFVWDGDRGVPADLTRSALQSPSKFAAYAAGSMFATLPPVAAAAPRIAK
jgi:hypothetical protein